MNNSDSFEKIYNENYKLIYNHCYARLNLNKQLAEECTQDVFLTLSKKMNILPLSTNVTAWLYKTANNHIKHYLRDNKSSNIPLEELKEISAEEEKEQDIFDNILTQKEYELLNDYIVNGESADKLAHKNNISKDAFYQRICRLKNKVIKNSDKLHNLLKK